MGWTGHHRRGDVLRAVSAAADLRGDGVLPMDVAGVRATFGDERTLLAALQLVWHARLAARVEQAVGTRPLDRESATVRAWCAAADDLPGLRRVLDRSVLQPDERAAARDHLLLASAVGRGSGADAGESGERDPGAVDVGARLEALARETREDRPGRDQEGAPDDADSSGGLLDRLRSVLPV